METKPNGPLSWEEEREQWKKAMELQKEGFLSRVQALEEELAKLKEVKSVLCKKCGHYNYLDYKFPGILYDLKEENKRLQEELQSWKDEHAQIVDDYGSVLKDKDEKIERLQERIKELETTLPPKE